MTAFKSKFVQFVMFYACELDPSTVVRDLLPRLQKFCIRPPNSHVLGHLVDWCNEYVKEQDGKINPETHGIFYSTCQQEYKLSVWQLGSKPVYRFHNQGMESQLISCIIFMFIKRPSFICCASE
ncbi:putative RNA polymerase I specific transcription initiation factor RRN3 [Rosa chinensis]|uniref:Putative RNA polymerase I specific transcription initiation factor RRN3 n=1 Tax=Rosa chinensis TaxID=74649 RepID=A0A2P6RL65_ROSCH|nr:putative RNA polymerase I specific transcription initiation factor RRN3 [Rosa chinensis]